MSIKGENVQMDLPHVGTFLIRNSTAAVNFHGDLVEDSKVNIFCGVYLLF